MENGYIAKTSGITGKDKVGYAIGDAASCLLFGLVQSVIQKYYTDILGLSAASIMVMFLVARIWDAINDPIWGRIIDGAPIGIGGRYRRWVLIFSVPMALAAILLFVKIPGLSPRGYLIYAYVTYILYGMLYTCINIPYGSLAQVITSDDRERSSLSVCRSVGAIIGLFPPMALIGMCYVTVGGKQILSSERILIGVTLIAGLSVLAYYICYLWTKERVVPNPAEKKSRTDTVNVIRLILKSRPFIAVCLASMLFMAAEMFSQSYSTYLFPYYFHTPSLSVLTAVCWYLPAIAVMTYTGGLGSRFGRRELCSYGILFSAVSMLVLWLIKTKSVWVYLIGYFFAGIGSASLTLLIWALAADAIDYIWVTHGLHDDATCYSFYSFARKLGQAFQAVLINSALLHIGYSDNVLNADQITGDTMNRMYNDSVLIPAILFLLVFVVLRFVYPLSKQKTEELQVKKNKAMGEQA